MTTSTTSTTFPFVTIEGYPTLDDLFRPPLDQDEWKVCMTHGWGNVQDDDLKSDDLTHIAKDTPPDQ